MRDARFAAPAGRPVNRRRALTIIAAGAAGIAAGAAGTAALALGRSGRADVRRFEWIGTAMGADARIVLYHEDRAEAERAVAAAVAEIDRLEDQFSLYRAHSALCELNRSGRLEAPSFDMRRLLNECLRFGNLSGGAFDVSVQPLWRLYADHFARRPTPTNGPDAAAVAEALTLVDYRRILLGADTVTLAPGMELTLNGIAQGYVTDRIAGLLERRGWTEVLVNLGELRALDGPPGGDGWMVTLAGARDARGGPVRVRLRSRAAATSSADGTRFEPTGRHHHLLDPRTGTSGRALRHASVLAPTATEADALSTALFAVPPERAPIMVAAVVSAEAWLTGPSGPSRYLKGESPRHG